jgi:uncharacterized RDD family membrane protein YckC
MQDVNPYEAPQASVADAPDASGRRQYLAGRWERLVAVIVDTLVYLPAAALYAIGIMNIDETEGAGPGAVLALAGAGLIGLGVLIVQLMMLHKNGWTIGKRALKIRIVRRDGSRASLGRIFWLRMVVMGLLGAIPLAGSVVSLVDVLMIFRSDRRTLHDMIADTKVVKAGAAARA